MPTATITSKGQMTVPQSVRESLGLQPGDKVDFVLDEGGGYRIVALRKDVKVLRGRFAGRAARPITIEEMSDAVLNEAAQRRRPHRRTKAVPRRAA